MPSSNAPILFLAYANDLVDPARKLRFLVPEIHAIRDLLNERVSPPYRIEVRDHASLDDIIAVFDRYEGQVSLFHYAGHADSFSLMLSNGELGNAPANLAGFARFLGEQPNLQHVFLNGCATEAHAEALVAAGVPSVIATNQLISDQAALIFSERFYERMADGKWVETAFEHAEIKTQTALMRGTDYRSLYLDEEADLPAGFPWKLYGEGRTWRFQLQHQPKQGAIVPLLCDRDRQVEVFRDSLENVLQDDDHLPQFYLIHGGQMERHRSLVTRFREVDIRYHSERMYGPELGSVQFFDIKDWPNTGDLSLRKRNLLRSIAFALNLPGIGGSQWNAQDLLDALGLSAGVIVFQHTIQGPEAQTQIKSSRLVG
ncbi:MAG: CHAT domain-containing protein [Bacteroidota bacterium]